MAVYEGVMVPRRNCGRLCCRSWSWSWSWIIFSSFLLLCLVFISAHSDEGRILLDFKRSLKDDKNALFEWTEGAASDYCSWRGITCNNITHNVVALNLSRLNLGGEISPAIGDLKTIESIDLSRNRLTGQIPHEIGKCLSLTFLTLSYNALYGDIPISISQLKKLEELYLENNQLTGPIPSTLSQIPNLKKLDLSQNRLSGEIPRLIYWNEVLLDLGLRNNFLSGILSPDMCQLTGLRNFNVGGNNLTGNIPENIGNCTSFEILDLSHNQLTGEIPFNIAFLQVATLSLQGNKLTGSIPEKVGVMQALLILDLSSNQLSGRIPPNLGNLLYTKILYLNNNLLTGQIPPELGNMSHLNYLLLNDNHLTGFIPPELGKLNELFELNLAGNSLEGPIPENISSCTALNILNVQGNRLGGSIPQKLERLRRLTSLNLSSNKFKEITPVELGNIINLDTLDLSNNEFCGSIPASLGELEHLLHLNLSGNQLNGHLPRQFANLGSLQDVDFSSNRLSGTIPEEFGRLPNLSLLILNNNSLSGQIPLALTECFNLTTLNLSYNNLSGDVPSVKNFSRFPPESFLGNALLCGNWNGALCGKHAQRSNGSISKTAIAFLTLGLITLALMIIVAVYRSYPRGNTKSSNKTAPGPQKLVILHMDMAIHTYDDIIRMTENFSEKYVIGYGATSTVYKCGLKNSKPVAIKRLYTHYQSNMREFETELETIGNIKHRNLVSLHGYSSSPHEYLLFYDYMVNGSLWDLLHGNSKKVKPDWETRLKIAVGAAQGLAYLHHDCNPRIIHRDVKTSNILLDENFEAHISDFGIARNISPAKAHTTTFVMGTIGYIDPEYARTSRLTEKSDVYSFGIVLLELLTGRKAVDNDANLHQLMLLKPDNNAVMETVDSDVSATCKDLGLVRKTFQLALLCTKNQASDRPNMQEVSTVLQSLLPLPIPAPSQATLTEPLDTVNRRPYLAEYGNGNHRNNLILDINGSDSSSDTQWFMKFSQVISP